jgi:hypothetical protein
MEIRRSQHLTRRVRYEAPVGYLHRSDRRSRKCAQANLSKMRPLPRRGCLKTESSNNHLIFRGGFSFSTSQIQYFSKKKYLALPIAKQ